MRKLKLIVLIIAILLVQGLAFGNEIVEKDGNTTKIKLLDKEKSYNKLIGYVPSETTTKNFKINRKKHIFMTGFWNDNSTSNPRYVNTNHAVFEENGSLQFFVIEDKDQNIASISEIKNFEFYEDEDYYYFDYDIVYNASDVVYDNGYNTGNGLQKINFGNLFLSNEPINKLSFSYKSNLNITQKSIAKTDGNYSNAYIWATGDYSNINYNDRIDNLSLTINDLTSEQEIKMSSGNTFTIDNKNISYSVNTSRLYLTLKFPFEDYVNNTIQKSDCEIKGGDSNGNFRFTPLINIQSKINQQIMFKNGQNNYIYPQKITGYDPIEQTSSYNELLNNWNNEFVGTIKIKKSDFKNYRYLNMYCPNAITVSDTGFSNTQIGDDKYVEAHDKNSNFKKLVTLNNYQIEANSVRSATAIDLASYMCSHEFTITKGNEVDTHELICQKCGTKTKENHSYIYEYDGILNNLCRCGVCKRIHNRYEYNSSITQDLDNIVERLSLYEKPNNPTKIGYVFNGYKLFLKRFKDEINPKFDIANTELVEKFEGDIEELPNITNEYSTRFEAKYLPIQYRVVFKSDNNKNLKITNHISDLNCQYDVEYDTPKININGYTFNGWSLATDSNALKVSFDEKIINLTINNNDEIVLYPNFSKKTQNDEEESKQPTTNNKGGGNGSGGGSNSGGQNRDNGSQDDYNNNNVINVENEISETSESNLNTTVISNNKLINALALQTKKNNKSRNNDVPGSYSNRQNNDAKAEIKLQRKVKELIAFLEEIYKDFIEQNNIKQSNRTTIVSFINKVHNDYKKDNNIGE